MAAGEPRSRSCTFLLEVGVGSVRDWRALGPAAETAGRAAADEPARLLVGTCPPFSAARCGAGCGRFLVILNGHRRRAARAAKRKNACSGVSRVHQSRGCMQPLAPLMLGGRPLHAAPPARHFSNSTARKKKVVMTTILHSAATSTSMSICPEEGAA